MIELLLHAEIVRGIAPLEFLVKEKDGIATFGKSLHALVCALTNMRPSDLYKWIRQVFFCQHSFRQKFFSERVIPIWNFLPNSVVRWPWRSRANVVTCGFCTFHIGRFCRYYRER